MARKPRFTLPGVPQHVVQRGNNREPCFFSEADYQRYKHDLHEAAERNNVAIHAYVLMTNHVHLLVTAGSSHCISYMMQDLGIKYVRYINHNYRRTGTLWEGRFKASLVDSEAYLFACMRYIELNPVRANMVSHPAEYPWSSYSGNALGRPDFLIQLHPVYETLGNNEKARQYCYRELFKMHMEHDEVHDIREALSQELVLGRDDFKEKIARMTRRQTVPGKPGRPRIKEGQGIYYVL